MSTAASSNSNSSPRVPPSGGEAERTLDQAIDAVREFSAKYCTARVGCQVPHHAIDLVLSTLAALRAEREVNRKAFLEYGQHEFSCPAALVKAECLCGFAAVLDQLRISDSRSA